MPNAVHTCVAWQGAAGMAGLRVQALTMTPPSAG